MAKIKEKPRTGEDTFRTHKNVPGGVNDSKPPAPVLDDDERFLGKLKKKAK